MENAKMTKDEMFAIMKADREAMEAKITEAVKEYEKNWSIARVNSINIDRFIYMHGEIVDTYITADIDFKI